MKDYRKYCRPKTIKFPQTGDIEVLLKDGTTVYVKAKDFLKVSKFFKDYSLYEEGSGSGNGSGHDYSQDYLTLVAEADNGCVFTLGEGISYSVDDGETWVENSKTPTIAKGNKVLLKGELDALPSGGSGSGSGSGSEAGGNVISSDNNYSIEGNIMSLFYGDNFIGEVDLTDKNLTFCLLFAYDTHLVNAEHLSLSATILVYGCYSYMFDGCTALTTAPSLPATTLAPGCYERMFSGCTSLTTAPELPATTLVKYCYYNMFNGCTSLITAPELPATTLAEGCYNQMFYGCVLLTTAPELLAMTLAKSCYESMFMDCSSLTTAPELPATTLATYCYTSMFYGCKSLTTAPSLPATTLAQGCYQNMFYGCSSLNYIKVAFTTIPSPYYTDNWVGGVAASGTFVKNDSATWNTTDVTGVDGVPSGWTLETYTP